MKILAKKGKTFHWDLCSNEFKNLYFPTKVHVKFDGHRNNKSYFRYTVLDITLKERDFTSMLFSSVLCVSAVKLISTEDCQNFFKMSLDYANKWRQFEKYPIAEGEFSSKVETAWKESLFNNETHILRGLLPDTQGVTSAVKKIMSRYFIAQDRQVLDYAKECKWTNKIVQKSFFREEDSGLYEGSHEIYFDEVFGREKWKIQTPDYRHSVITFGIDPYPFVVFLSPITDHFEIRVLANIDGKFYERPLNINLRTAEKQIEIAVMLIMTNAQGESNEAVPAEAKA